MHARRGSATASTASACAVAARLKNAAWPALTAASSAQDAPPVAVIVELVAQAGRIEYAQGGVSVKSEGVSAMAGISPAAAPVPAAAGWPRMRRWPHPTGNGRRATATIWYTVKSLPW
jgi:hypothetical protein